jgi:predicted nucleotidyltransferase
MPALLEDKRAQIEELCRQFRVRRLDVFGSAIRDDFDPGRSDVDFLVEFEPDPDLNTFHAYMDLREALSSLLERPVDLVMAGAVRNRYIKAAIEATREPVYAA